MSYLSPKLVTDIFLNPGDLYFGGPNVRVRTLLGSCVSIVLWHPKLHFGGMCHYLLVTKGDKNASGQPQGKYGEDAFQFLLNSVKSHLAPISEYEAKVFGGSNMFSKNERTLIDPMNETNSKLVGIRNIEFAKDILQKHSIKLVSENTAGVTHRKVFFTIWDGEVWLESHQDS